MVLRVADPFQTLMALQRALSDTRGRDWFGLRTAGRGGFPLLNVFQKNEDFVLIAELPGVEKDSLDIQIKNNEVRISGTKSIDYDEQQSVHRRERLAGQFDRTMQIPAEIDSEKVTAEYRNGVLTIFLPRSESDKPRSVRVG